MSGSPITGDQKDDKHGDYEPRSLFHGAQYLLDLLHECRQLPLEFITQTLIQNFN